jgi:hypothetical protein
MIEILKDCLIVDFPVVPGKGFTEWLLKSNNPKVGPYLGEDRFKDMLVKVENESLQEILDILLKEPLADYFWYTYKEHGSRLTYSIPSPEIQAVPAIREGDALRVDKEKMKVFLRDIKIEKILQ